MKCTRGVFTLPDEVYETLRTGSPSGLVFMRQADDVLIISAERLVGARRRHLHHTYKAPMFHAAIRLAIVNMADTFQVMAVEWRKNRVRNGASEGPATR